MPGLGKSGTSRISDFRLSIRPRSDFDLKIGIALQGGLLLVDPAHVGKAGAFAQGRSQVGKFIGRPGGVYLHAPIVQIAHVAGHTQGIRHTLCVVAIADALHAPAHQVEPRGWGVAGHGRDENSMMKMLQNGERASMRNRRDAPYPSAGRTTSAVLPRFWHPERAHSNLPVRMPAVPPVFRWPKPAERRRASRFAGEGWSVRLPVALL